MKLKISLMLVVVLAALALVPVSAQDEFIFGMILVGPDDDGGWSQAHFEGGKYVEEQLPGTKMLVFESLNPGDSPEATLESVTRNMVDAGAKLIITSSDSFEQDTDKVAALFPDVVFVNMSGSNALEQKAYDVFPDLVSKPETMAEATPPNVGNIMAQMEIDKAVAGCAAALMTETGKIGYLGPLINPETRRLAASVYLGARYCYEKYRGMDPAELEFSVQWIGFWFHIPGQTLDPTEEVDTFFNLGADVVLSGIDTTQAVVVAGQRAAKGERVFSVAYDSIKGCDEYPASCLGVPYYNWGPVYVDLVKSVMDGTWEQTWEWVAPSWDEDSIVGYKFGDGLTEAAKTNLEAFIEEAKAYSTDEANADTIFLWTGPLKLQDGYELAAEGEPVDLLKIWYLPQLLEGMRGKSQ